MAGRRDFEEVASVSEGVVAPGGGRGPRVVALGGGHGLAATLEAARSYAGELTAVVSVADDGGSSGRLRESFGIPAPGDLRRCLVAMARRGPSGGPGGRGAASVWARVFDHRFSAGELEGHAFGNLIITGLTEATGDFTVALEEAARLLEVEGRVLPATTVAVVLKAQVAGRAVVGQARVADGGGPISAVSIIPPDAAASPEAVRAIAEADQVLIGPGSLFTSVLAACVVPEIRQAIAARPGGRVYVCNLRPQPGETDGFGLHDHLDTLVAHGIAVDTAVVDPAVAAGVAADEGPARVVSVPVARADGLGHDVGRLGRVLASLLR